MVAVVPVSGSSMLRVTCSGCSNSAAAPAAEGRKKRKDGRKDRTSDREKVIITRVDPYLIDSFSGTSRGEDGDGMRILASRQKNVGSSWNAGVPPVCFGTPPG